MEKSNQQFHYGDLIESTIHGSRFYVRAVAPGVCVVIAPDFYPLHELLSDGALIVVRREHWHLYRRISNHGLYNGRWAAA